MSGSNGSPFFRVDASKAVISRLKEILDTSKKGARLAASLKSIYSKLRRSAREFGEPVFTLTHGKFQIRVAVVGSLAVQYGVHLEEPNVVIQGFTELA